MGSELIPKQTSPAIDSHRSHDEEATFLCSAIYPSVFEHDLKDFSEQFDPNFFQADFENQSSLISA